MSVESGTIQQLTRPRVTSKIVAREFCKRLSSRLRAPNGLACLEFPGKAPALFRYDLFQRQPIRMLVSDNYNDWRIGLIPHIPGFPLPVVGLVAPTSRWHGTVSLHISKDVALHVGAADVVVQETTFSDFRGLSLDTVLGQAVEATLGSGGTVNPFDLVAVTSYCISKGISSAPDVDRAARLILEAYRELARQILAQNLARFN